MCMSLARQNGVVIRLPQTVEAAPHCVAGRVRLSDDNDTEWGRGMVGEHIWCTERVSNAGKMQMVRSGWTVERKEMLGGRCCGHGMRWRRMTCLKEKNEKMWPKLETASCPDSPCAPVDAVLPLCTCGRCALSNASQLLGSTFLQIFVSSYVIPSRSWNMKFKACV